MQQHGVHLRGQFPRHADCIRLKIVSKAEVPQHLEEAVMPSCHSNVFQVIGSYTFLCCRCSVVLPLSLPDASQGCSLPLHILKQVQLSNL